MSPKWDSLRASDSITALTFQDRVEAIKHETNLLRQLCRYNVLPSPTQPAHRARPPRAHPPRTTHSAIEADPTTQSAIELFARKMLDSLTAPLNCAWNHELSNLGNLAVRLSCRALFLAKSFNGAFGSLDSASIAECVVRGGWPAAVGRDVLAASAMAKRYIGIVAEEDLSRVDGSRR